MTGTQIIIPLTAGIIAICSTVAARSETDQTQSGVTTAQVSDLTSLKAAVRELYGHDAPSDIAIEKAPRAPGSKADATGGGTTGSGTSTGTQAGSTTGSSSAPWQTAGGAPTAAGTAAASGSGASSGASTGSKATGSANTQVFTGVVLTESDNRLHLDTKPCEARRIVEFSSPYVKNTVGSVTCGSKTLTKVEVIQK
jgi:hypothetical protein